MILLEHLNLVQNNIYLKKKSNPSFRQLLVCSRVSIETDCIPVQGLEQMLCEEKTDRLSHNADTQKPVHLLFNEECESSCYQRVWDVLSPQNMEPLHLIFYDAVLFQNQEIRRVQVMWHFFPVSTDVGTHLCILIAEIICTIVAIRCLCEVAIP